MARSKTSCCVLLVVALASVNGQYPMMGMMGGFNPLMGMGLGLGMGGLGMNSNAGTTYTGSMTNNVGANAGSAAQPYPELSGRVSEDPNVLTGAQIIRNNAGQVFEGFSVTIRPQGSGDHSSNMGGLGMSPLGMGGMYSPGLMGHSASMMGALGQQAHMSTSIGLGMPGMHGLGGLGGLGGMHGLGGLGGMGHGMGGLGGMSHGLEANIEVKLRDGQPPLDVFLVVLDSARPGLAGSAEHCLPQRQGAVMTGPSDEQSNMMNQGFGAFGSMLGGFGFNPMMQQETDFGVITDMTVQGGTNKFQLTSLGRFTDMRQLAGRGIALVEDVMIGTDGRPYPAGNEFQILFCATLNYDLADIPLV